MAPCRDQLCSGTLARTHVGKGLTLSLSQSSGRPHDSPQTWGREDSKELRRVLPITPGRLLGGSFSWPLRFWGGEGAFGPAQNRAAGHETTLLLSTSGSWATGHHTAHVAVIWPLWFGCCLFGKGEAYSSLCYVSNKLSESKKDPLYLLVKWIRLCLVF